jgi:hypothetical protein
MFGCFSQVAVLFTAMAAGAGYFSFWWALIPAFFAGSLAVSNGPGFDIVMSANREGRLGVFPRVLALSFLPWLIVAGAVYWVTALISN